MPAWRKTGDLNRTENQMLHRNQEKRSLKVNLGHNPPPSRFMISLMALSVFCRKEKLSPPVWLMWLKFD